MATCEKNGCKSRNSWIIMRKLEQSVTCPKCRQNRWELLQGKATCLVCGRKFHMSKVPKVSAVENKIERSKFNTFIICSTCNNILYVTNMNISFSKEYAIPRENYYGTFGRKNE